MRNAGVIEVIDLVVPLVQPPAVTQQVEGRIVFDHGAPAEGLKLRLYRKGFGGAEGESLLKETTVREQGVYSLPYKTDAQAANLEVRAVDANGKEISLSTIIKNASATEVLNLVAPATMQPMAAEFNRLSTDLQPHIRGDLTRLRIARETADQQDCPCSTSNRLGCAPDRTAAIATGSVLPTRLACPRMRSMESCEWACRATSSSWLASVPRRSIRLEKARTSGDRQYERYAGGPGETISQRSAPTQDRHESAGIAATYGELLNQVRLSTNDQQTFANVYLNHRDDGKSLWEEATAAGLGKSCHSSRSRASSRSSLPTIPR